MKINVIKFEAETIKEMNILKATLEKVDFIIMGSRDGEEPIADCPCKASFDGQGTVIEPLEGYTISKITAGASFHMFAEINWETQETILTSPVGGAKYLIKRSSARK